MNTPFNARKRAFLHHRDCVKEKSPMRNNRVRLHSQAMMVVVVAVLIATIGSSKIHADAIVVYHGNNPLISTDIIFDPKPSKALAKANSAADKLRIPKSKRAFLKSTKPGWTACAVVKNKSTGRLGIYLSHCDGAGQINNTERAAIMDAIRRAGFRVGLNSYQRAPWFDQSKGALLKLTGPKQF